MKNAHLAACRASRRLLLSSVALAFLCLPAAAQTITTPEKFLGFKPGADFHLQTYEQAIGYLEQLSKESPRIKVFDMGPTSFGRRQKYAVVSSEENLAKLDRYKEISRRLSLARGLSEAEARKLADEGKAIVWIDGGLHASEVVGSNQQVQLAYDVVTGEDRRTKSIRDSVILLILFTNPDGMTMVADWYTKHVGTSFETSPLPELYQRYAGHDNNRESQIANLQETRNTHQLVNHEWFPEVYYNQHQTGPFPARYLDLANGQPANPNVHPIVRRIENLVGVAGAKGMEDAGLAGVISRVSYDYFYSGSVLAVAEGHNIPSVLTESTANYGYATPHFYKLSDFPDTHRDLVPGQFYPNPWKGGWWRFADQILYNLTTSKSILEVAAFYRADFLFAKWRAAADTIERFKNEPPYGWIVSADQRDQNTTAMLLDRFLLQGFEIYAADEAFTHEGVAYPKGSCIIPTSQAFGLYVKNLLERQELPDLRQYPHLWQGQPRTQRYFDQAKNEEMLPPLMPYDNAGWTMPLLMGIDSRAMTTPLKVAMHPLAAIASPAGSVSGVGPQVIFGHTGNNSFTAVNRIQKAGGRVNVALDRFTLGGATYSAGTFIVDAASVPAGTLREIAAAVHVPMTAGAVAVASSPLPRPRIGVYLSWDASMDAGWTTFLLEQYEFPFTPLHDADIRAGRLGDRLDAIILPDQNPDAIVGGHAVGTMPAEYVGGMTGEGVENLRRFVEAGGTLVCNKASLDLAVRTFNLPVRNVARGLSQKEFFVPGSILRVDYDTTHPVAYGLEEKGVGYISGAHAFELIGDQPESEKPDKTGTPARESVKKPAIAIVARFPDEPLLLSGFLIGEKTLRGKAVVLDAPVGRGHVVLFGFNVQNRAQSHATHKLLYNALFSRGAAGAGTPGGPPPAASTGAAVKKPAAPRSEGW